MLIFSIYWTCTVITTVGYGDYSGGTTLEFQFTLGLEFLGFVIYSVIQIAVLKIVNIESSSVIYFMGMDEQTLNWLMVLEKSTIPDRLPNELYHDIKE